MKKARRNKVWSSVLVEQQDGRVQRRREADPGGIREKQQRGHSIRAPLAPDEREDRRQQRKDDGKSYIDPVKREE